MLNFFQRKKPGIEAISFPSFGWEQRKDTPEMKQWLNKERSIALSINYFSRKPDIPSLKNIKYLREYYRTQMWEVNGGLIQVDVIDLRQIKTIKTIFKIPQQPTGMVYLASLTIPFKYFSYVVKIQSTEVGLPGMREGVIASRLMRKGEITSAVNGYENWSYDPYESAYKKGTLMNKSELEEYDSEFGQHPLTIARKVIGNIQENILLSAELRKVKTFDK